MVKTPKTRHSKSRRRPVTIDLDPASVSRTSDNLEKTGVKPAMETGATSDAAAKGGPDKDTGETKPVAGYSGTPSASSPESKTDASEQPKVEERQGDPFASSTERPGDHDKSPENEAEQQQAPQSRNGAGMALFAGIVGAVVALVLAGLLQWAGILPAVTNSGGSGQIDDLRQQVASLRDDVSNVSDGSADAATAKKISDLQETINSVQTKLGDMQSGDATSAKSVQSLETRISALEKQISGLARNGDAQKAVDALDQRVSKVQAALQSATDAANEALTSNGARLKALDDSVSELANKVRANGSQPTVVRLVAATALKSAIDSGVPYADALGAFSKVTPDAPGLDRLGQFAETGIDTRAALANEVDDVASAMVAAARKDDPNAGYAEKLWNSARGLVNVRPVGSVEGNDVPDIVARFEADVKAGDYDKALAEYAKLPDEAKSAGKAFADRLKARQAADSIMDKALSDALKAA